MKNLKLFNYEVQKIYKGLVIFNKGNKGNFVSFMRGKNRSDKILGNPLEACCVGKNEQLFR